jgi:hypothetical protein
MKKAVVIAIPSSHIVTTTLIYTLLISIFLEVNELSNEEKDNNINNAYIKLSAPELVDASCKSPCPSTAEMCIQMCA